MSSLKIVRDKAINFIKTVEVKKLFALCYIIAVVALVMFVLISFATDRILRATGLLQSETLTFDDVVMWEIIPTDDGKMFSFSVDPQIHLPEKEQLISSVELKMYLEEETGELAAYYTTENEPEYSVANRVFGYKDSEGVVFDFGLKKVTSIRLDPASYVTVLGVFNGVIVNPERSLIDFFRFSGATIYFLALIPAMVVALICTFKQILVNNEVSTS